MELRIGTAAEGQTFPAIGVPFAMTDWTPQTRDGEKKCNAPYYDRDRRLQGFRGSHFLSGSCTQDYGSFTLMPESGALRLGAKERGVVFRHEDEVLHPHLYQVELRSVGIGADVTGTARSGFMRFRFARREGARVVIQTNSRPGVSGSSLHIDAAAHEVYGENLVHRLYAGEGRAAGFSGYFVMQFDHAFREVGTWTVPGGAALKHAGQTSVEAERGPVGAYLGFALRPDEPLLVRIGTSFTSVEEARRNLQAEIPGWSFDSTVAQARAAWETALSKVTVAGQSTERRVFYSALYHSMLLPRTFSDVDGSYPSFGGGRRVETAKGFTYYDDFSLWDTFRALHPLLTILDPQREGEMMASLVAKGQQGGFLPIFPAWNSYTTEMIGDHADAVLVDAYRKGIRGFDAAEAYRLMRHNAMDTPPQPDYIDGLGRRALRTYLRYGYIPLEDHVPFAFHKDEQVSRTLEYAYDDYLVGQMAGDMGKTEDASLFASRGENWKNVIDPATGFARGRYADGRWTDTQQVTTEGPARAPRLVPFNPGLRASFITEGLPFQYTFFVPQDIPGLIARLGGPEAFEAKLDELFARGYYDQGNEPSHHIAYLYNFTGSAWKAQEHLRDVMDRLYKAGPDGLSGNDDAGQMSAWYVMSALGLYPVTPGRPEYELSTPRFDDTTVRLPGGRSLRIEASGSEAGDRYIRAVTWNGVPVTGHNLSHEAVMAGGTLVFTLTRQPYAGWPTRRK